jgi:hypothetical protein
MKASHWAIAEMSFPAAGAWSIFSPCHGDAGLQIALPVAGSKVSLKVGDDRCAGDDRDAAEAIRRRLTGELPERRGDVPLRMWTSHDSLA